MHPAFPHVCIRARRYSRVDYAVPHTLKLSSASTKARFHSRTVSTRPEGCVANIQDRRRSARGRTFCYAGRGSIHRRRMQRNIELDETDCGVQPVSMDGSMPEDHVKEDGVTTSDGRSDEVSWTCFR